MTTNAGLTSSFANNVLSWFAAHGRKDLPWQIEATPYRVWVSEIMLQQTQVATVIPYYARFMESFPDIDALANASMDDVLHHWSGLGYYARARNLHKAAQSVRDDFNGAFPLGFDDVIGLPGIGRSTAGAILAIAASQRHAILDGNVKRVLARFHAVDGWPGTGAVANKLWQFADLHTPASNVAAYTQAMMDLGATVCTRTKPACAKCPLVTDCAAHQMRRQMDYPGRKVRQAKPLRKTKMVLLHSRDAVYLERRPFSGIWGGLWSLPELGPDQEAPDWCDAQLNLSVAGSQRWETVRHSFTHFDLDIEPIVVRVDDVSSKVQDTQDQIWYQLNSPQKVGLAAPVSDLIEKLRCRSAHENVPDR